MSDSASTDEDLAMMPLREAANLMGYGDRIQVIDRWAIIAYLRALQKSQGGATVADVPAGERAQLEAQ